MITPDYTRVMAAYNRWQNGSLYEAAGNLTDAERREDRGLFFGSLHGTFNHLIWGDKAWLTRFTGREPPRMGSVPESIDEYGMWDVMVEARRSLDQEIIDWTEEISEEFLDSELSYYSVAAHRQISKPRWVLVTHFFNHQTHHRGQIHGILTGLGQKPDDTDLPFMPET